MEPKRLYRSRTNRMLCGVCGGVAEYFNIDPTIVRIAAVMLLWAGSFLAYIVCAVIVPEQPMDYQPPTNGQQPPPNSPPPQG